MDLAPFSSSTPLHTRLSWFLGFLEREKFDNQTFFKIPDLQVTLFGTLASAESSTGAVPGIATVANVGSDTFCPLGFQIQFNILLFSLRMTV